MFFPVTPMWTKQEQANAFVHALIALLVTSILWNGFFYFAPFRYWGLFGGLICFVVELIRQLIFDKPERNAYWYKDKFRDFLCYQGGAALALYFKNFPIV
jgi:hypothetical protein